MKKILSIGIPFIVLFMSCKDNEDSGSVKPQPDSIVINSFSPEEGISGDEITIMGSGFSLDNNVVFNGIKASVISIGTDAKSLTVKVPDDATSGKISITKGNLTSISEKNFTVTPLEIISFLPFSSAGKNLTITGTGFGKKITDLKVLCSGIQAQVVSSSSTEIKIIVPDGAKSGKLSISRINKTTLSQSNLSIVSVSNFFVSKNGLLDLTPSGIYIDPKDNKVYISENVNGRILLINSDDTYSVIAGSTSGYQDGLATSAKFLLPSGIILNQTGDFIIVDNNNHRIRKLSAGTVSTLSGNGTFGKVDGDALTSQFTVPDAIAIGSNGDYFISEQAYIRKVTSTGTVTTFTGGSSGYADGNSSIARFGQITSLVADQNGNLYVADRDNHCIRKITPQGETSTYAGTSSSGYKDGEKSTAAFNSPKGLCISKDGTIYVLDSGNRLIRRISTNGIVDTIADITSSSSKDISVDSNGNLYITRFSAIEKYSF